MKKKDLEIKIVDFFNQSLLKTQSNTEKSKLFKKSIKFFYDEYVLNKEKLNDFIDLEFKKCDFDEMSFISIFMNFLNKNRDVVVSEVVSLNKYGKEMELSEDHPTVHEIICVFIKK